MYPPGSKSQEEEQLKWAPVRGKCSKWHLRTTPGPPLGRLHGRVRNPARVGRGRYPAEFRARGSIWGTSGDPVGPWPQILPGLGAVDTKLDSVPRYEVGGWHTARPTDGCAHQVPASPWCTQRTEGADMRETGVLDHPKEKLGVAFHTQVTGIMAISPKEPGSTRRNRA